MDSPKQEALRWRRLHFDGQRLSLYARFSTAGAPPSDAYWSGPELAWTSKKAYGGNEFPIDHAL